MNSEKKSTAKFGRISSQFINTLLARISLEEVVDVDLKKDGSLLGGHCPFHPDKKSRSFKVYPDQHYYCYGCHTTGNAISYVMARQNLSFVEAVQQLADRCGMTVEYDDNGLDEQTYGLYEMMMYSREYYHRQLQTPDPLIKEFITQRGLTQETIEKFQIGWATNAPITADFKKAGYTEAQLLEASLLNPGVEGKKAYPYFRNRLMFPILNSTGKVIGYTARLVVTREGGDDAKWLHSKDTVLMSKKTTLFNWYFAARHSTKQVLVVEGAMDAVIPAQYGIENIIATLGTALSEQQIKFLFKRTEEIILLFDGDSAGQNAQWRVMEKILPYLQDGKYISFIALPEGEDPDSFVRSVGKESFLAYITEKKVSVSAYLLTKLKERYKLDSAEQVAAAKKKGLALVGTMDQQTLLAQEIKRQINSLAVEDPLVSRLAELRKKAPSLTPTELLATLMGEQAQAIEADPIIIAQEREEAFPLDALGSVLGDVVKAIIEVTRFPVSLGAQGVLAAASLAAQGTVQVQIYDGDSPVPPVPISEFYCSIGDTGEGKGFIDSLVLKPHRLWDEGKFKEFKQQQDKYFTALEEWHDKVRAAKKSQDADDEAGDKPKPPRQLGGILYDSPTWEAIERGCINGKASVGLFAEEGMRFLGDFGMNRDNQNKTSGGLIKLWNNGSGARQRAQEEEYYRDRALSMHIAIQSKHADKYLLGNDDMVEIGLFSRILFIKPDSTQGSRPWNEFTPTGTECFRRYSQRMTELLDETEGCTDQETGELKYRSILFLSREAKKMMVDFHNEIQIEIGDAETKAAFCRELGQVDPSPGVNGKYISIRPFVNKGAVHAVRLAATLQIVEEGRPINISAVYMERGIRLVRYYFNEILRIFNTATVSIEQINAQAVLEWMRNNEKHAENGVFKLRILQKYVPPRMRDRDKLLNALNILHTHNYGELLKAGRSFQFKLFPMQTELDCRVAAASLPHGKATYNNNAAHAAHAALGTNGNKKNPPLEKSKNPLEPIAANAAKRQSTQIADYQDVNSTDGSGNMIIDTRQTQQLILKQLNGHGVPITELRESVCLAGVSTENFDDALEILREEDQVSFDGEVVSLLQHTYKI